MLTLDKNSAQIKDLAPGTAYLFIVQALGSDDNSEGSRMEEHFETLTEGMEQNPSTSFTSFMQMCVSNLVFSSRKPVSELHCLISGGSWGGDDADRSVRVPFLPQTVSKRPALLPFPPLSVC